MNHKHVTRRYLLCASLMTLVFSIPLFADGARRGDLDDASDHLSAMTGMVRNREVAGTTELGNKAITSIERALNDEKDSGKADKLKQAVLRVRGAMGAASRQEWGTAEGDVAAAMALVNSVR